MNAIVELLKIRLPSPRWEVTRDTVVDQPVSAAEAVAALEHDLPMLERLLQNGGDEQHAVDVRITAEHAVLLIGRLIPALNTVLADLFMTDIFEIEDDDRCRDLKNERAHVAAELRSVTERWRLAVDRWPEGNAERVRTTLDIALVVAEMNVVCVRALRTLLVSRL